MDVNDHLGLDPLPIVVKRPVVRTAPLVFASPHSGRSYPAGFLAQSRLDQHALRRSEDSFIEEIFGAAPALGMPLLAANFPRAYCDVNREAWELDPAMFDEPLPAWVNTTSPRVSAGLGTIPRVVAAGQSIYGHRLPFSLAEARIRDCWQPYHAVLSQLITATMAEFGYCLLVDCHSMPASPGGGRPEAPEVVLGDVHGTACSNRVTRIFEDGFRAAGYRVGRNDPYAGGYTTRHYGRPRDGLHAIQIEIARGLYMNEARIEPHAGLARLSADMERLMSRLAVEDWSWLGR